MALARRAGLIVPPDLLVLPLPPSMLFPADDTPRSIPAPVAIKPRYKQGVVLTVVTIVNGVTVVNGVDVVLTIVSVVASRARTCDGTCACKVARHKY